VLLASKSWAALRDYWRFPALLLRIDSPGGTVGDSRNLQCSEVADSKLKLTASAAYLRGVISMRLNTSHGELGTISSGIGVILRGNNLERLLPPKNQRFVQR